MIEAQSRLDQALQEDKHRASDQVKTLERFGYIVEKVIGKGTFATVKKAHWKKVNMMPVAIKIISKISKEKSYLQKCVPRELEVIRTVKHKNVINFLEIIETNMRIYIVMQYAENGSLLELIRGQGKVSEATGRRYYRELLDAMQYLHGCGFAHRDIKLENIVLDGNDQIKLIDFGFACPLPKPTDAAGCIEPYRSKTYCGSSVYASPELLRCKPYEPVPADVWASGVVLYTLLFGRLPFSSNKDTKALQKRIAEGVRFPSAVPVSSEVKVLLRNIFVPVEQRLTTELIKRSQWFAIELVEE